MNKFPLFFVPCTIIIMERKYIFVTGGVCSSLGKGITASSIGALIEAHGYKVSFVKADPYLNVDAGTMSPLEHGEVYITKDGGETDLDAGNYERFTSHVNESRHSITTGKIYQSVIEKERKGIFLGKCIQLIPHLTDEIKASIVAGGNSDTDVVIIEIGGTVGDIESTPFLEGARQLRHEFGRENVAFVHVTYVPFLAAAKEFKTKPTQHSVMKLREIGIQPDFLLCRTEKPLTEGLKKKISLFTQVKEEHVIDGVDCKHSIYEVPLRYYEQGFSRVVLERLGLSTSKAEIGPWKNLVNKIVHLEKEVEIALVGKYIRLKDADLSVYEALSHGGFANNVRVKVRPIESEYFTPESVKGVDGILVPGGFGKRGIEGMVRAAEYAKQHKIPYFGICLGLHVMLIGHARHALGLTDADSSEFNADTKHPVITLLDSQKNVTKKGGTMRLGIYDSVVKDNSLFAKLYGNNTIQERHRHRYEVNNDYLVRLEQSGVKVNAITNDILVEGMALDNHPFYLGVQYHPELQSSPMKPHPLFKGFIKAAIDFSTKK